MTDRDKLIKTLNDWARANNDGTEAESIADYLLANGIIVPPCNVGDMVHVIYNNKVIKGKVDSLEMLIEKDDTSYVAGVKFFDRISMIKGFLFGLNVFLTKEEAEAKLRGLQNG